MPNYHLVLSLLKSRKIGVFWKKKSSSNRCSPLNSSIEKDVVLPNYHLVLSLLKSRKIGVFWEKKNPVQTGAAP